jgi:glucose-6-phosphate isomerase
MSIPFLSPPAIRVIPKRRYRRSSEAESRKAQIVILSAGGKLAEYAKTKNYPLFLIPSGIQPRMSSFYFLAAFIQILEPLGLID